VDASPLLAIGDGEDVESVCYLCLDGGGAIVRAEAQMLDLSISPALLNMHHAKVSRRVDD
jgi:hypothetical protein